MPIFRVHKETNYTTIDNNIFKNKEISIKATGLLAIMLSLPDDWDFSEVGLATLKTDNRQSIRTALNELERHGYLVRERTRDEKGRLKETIYNVYEKPMCDFPTLEKPTLENHTQLNTNIIKGLNNKKKEIYKERFKKPTLEDITEYCKSRNNNIDPKTFFDYYSVNNWKDVKNWKQKIITWEMHDKQPKKKTREQEFQEQLERMRKLDEEEGRL